ncbi:MAG: pyridoxal phosphate-dependent aminotransferase, partial [Sphingobacteriia bacterium]|nr:pyridoxal phosphate-dependent aminotransferase [Sphingobacteriia bacterium]
MRQTPINYEIVSQKIKESNLPSVGRATIREIKKLVDQIEEATNTHFVRMEMGIPGLPAAVQGVRAQIDALEKGVASIYPDIQGTASLKLEISRFVKNFLDISVQPDGCIPTVGSMQGGFAAFMTVNRMHKDREGTLFLDPGFPVHKQQIKILGQDCRSFDVYNYRGEKLREKLNEMTADGKVSSILYSNPNNPSWICFTDEELRIIADVANEKEIVVIEDLAYFAMDFRHDYGKPGVAPYQPTVAKYTDNFILLISSSKAFSYAGERIAMMVISDKLFSTSAPDLTRFYSSAN